MDIFNSDQEQVVHGIDEKNKNYYDKYGNKLEFYDTAESSSSSGEDADDYYTKKIKEKVKKTLLSGKKKKKKKRKHELIGAKDDVLELKPLKLSKKEEKKIKTNPNPNTLDDAIDILLSSYKQYLKILKREPLKFVAEVAGLVNNGGVEQYIKTAPSLFMDSIEDKISELDMRRTSSIMQLVKSMAFLVKKDKSILKYRYNNKPKEYDGDRHPIETVMDIKAAFHGVKKHMSKCSHNLPFIKEDMVSAIDKVNEHLDHFLRDKHTYLIGAKRKPQILVQDEATKKLRKFGFKEQIIFDEEALKRFKKKLDELKLKAGESDELQLDLDDAEKVIFDLEKQLKQSKQNEIISKEVAKSFQTLINDILLRQQKKIEVLKGEQLKEQRLLETRERLRDGIVLIREQIEQLKRTKLTHKIGELEDQLDILLKAGKQGQIELDESRRRQIELERQKDEELAKQEDELRRQLIRLVREKDESNAVEIERLRKEFTDIREARKKKEEKKEIIKEISELEKELKEAVNKEDIEELREEIEEKRKELKEPSAVTVRHRRDPVDLEDEFRSSLTGFIEGIFNDQLLAVARKRILQNPNLFLGIALKEQMTSHIKKAHCEVIEQSGLEDVSLRDLMFQERHCIRSKFAAHVAELLKLTQVQEKVVFNKSRYNPVKREVLREETIDFIRLEWQCLEYSITGELRFVSMQRDSRFEFRSVRESGNNIDVRMMQTLKPGVLANILLRDLPSGDLNINKLLSDF